MSAAQMSLRRLRVAVQNNEVSFPAQVPIFICQSRADIQWRLVELYFVHNWSCQALGKRYGVAKERIRQLLSQWVRRATVLGYLQVIPATAVGHPVAEPGAASAVLPVTPLLSQPLARAAVASDAA